jgi:hypothetical protein
MEFAVFGIKPPDEKYHKIGFIGKDHFNKNIKHLKNSYLFKNDRPTPVTYTSWNKKYYIILDNGSHHLAALYKQCMVENIKFEFDAKVYIEELDKNAIEIFTNKWHSFIVNRKTASSILRLFEKSEIRCYFVLNDCLRKNPKNQDSYIYIERNNISDQIIGHYLVNEPTNKLMNIGKKLQSYLYMDPTLRPLR